MKRRIRKKKLTIRLYHINQALIQNACLLDRYKHDDSAGGLFARVAIPFSNRFLKFKKCMLENKLKRGDY